MTPSQKAALEADLSVIRGFDKISFKHKIYMVNSTIKRYQAADSKLIVLGESGYENEKDMLVVNFADPNSNFDHVIKQLHTTHNKWGKKCLTETR